MEIFLNRMFQQCPIPMHDEEGEKEEEEEEKKKKKMMMTTKRFFMFTNKVVCATVHYVATLL